MDGTANEKKTWWGTHRQQCDFTDRWVDTKGYKNRQQGDLISLLLFFLNNESGPKYGTEDLRFLQ
jgi:hypothetical protein